ncbi:MAG: hypothetical protein MJZ57_09005 [Bacteroidales bacterium]|nr:hypothetical protein [Bacteroidales bacterium]
MPSRCLRQHLFPCYPHAFCAAAFIRKDCTVIPSARRQEGTKGSLHGSTIPEPFAHILRCRLHTQRPHRHPERPTTGGHEGSIKTEKTET